MTKSAFLLASAFGALAISAPVIAQDAEQQISGDDQAPFDDGDATEAEDEAVLSANTIIITASKRAQTLQETPIAVSVTDGDTIEQAQIRDLIDLQSVVPSLRVGQLQNSAATNFSIRGFGNGANNPGIEPSVGVFIDGVYRSRSAAQITDLPNIERIEVLRGPQSTLFGKNASAGVISVVTAEPEFNFGGSASLTYGNRDTIVAKADITGPISESIAFALSGDYQTRDGYVDVVNLDQDINNRDRWNVRGQLLIEPNDDLKVRLIGDYSEIDEECCAVKNLINGPTGPLFGALIGQPALFPESPFRDEVLLSQTPRNQIENYGGSAQVDYDLGPISLTSITAYREVSAGIDEDIDYLLADLITQVGQTDIETFTQELRVTSDFDGPLNFLLGGYYFDENIDFSNQVLFGTTARPYFDALSGGAIGTVEGILGLPVGTTFSQPGQGITDQFQFSNEAYSFFGTVDFEVTDRLTLTGGFNYTKDRKDVVSDVINTDPFSAIDLVALGVAIGVPPAFADNPAANPLLGLQPLQFLPPFLNFPNAVEDGKTRDSDWSWTLRGAYDVTDEISAYAVYATGFKASSFNLSRDSRPTAADFTPGSPVTNPPASPIRDAGLAPPNLTVGSRFAGPEESTVYELGIKGAFPQVAFNLAVFQQEIAGFQSNTFTGTGFQLANAGKQSTFGIEFDGSVTPVDPLTIFLAVTYLDPTYDDFQFSALGDITGETPAGIPPIAMSLGASYTQDIGTAQLILRGDFNYEGAVQIAQGLPGFIDRSLDDPFAPARDVARPFRREVREINVSATVRLDNGLELSAYARNLTNQRYITTIFDGVAQSGSVFGYVNQPRTYGGTVRYKF
ncbi:MAG: TonB-dependent receptor [Pacificimonas sp.]